MIKILVLTISLSSFPTKKDLTEIYNIIKFVETNNNPKAVGDDGRAYGILQIHWVCINDVNKTYNTEFRHRDAFDIETSKEIFNLYISKGVKLYRNKYNKDPTEQDVVRMWNGGCYKGYLYKSTVRYWKRYLYFKVKLSKNKVPNKKLSLWNNTKDSFNGNSLFTFNRREYSFLYWYRKECFKSV